MLDLVPEPVWTLAVGGGIPDLVRDMGVALLVAGFLAVAFTRLRLPPIAAFLVAGVIAGPVGMGMVDDEGDNIQTIASLGLILLLFLIGLEIDIRKLLASGRTVIIAGLVQFPLCVLFGWLLAMTLVTLGVGGTLLAGTGAGPNYAPLYVGFVTAASSTLIVVKLMQERFELDTSVGRVALGLLIFQDIWAIVVIALQPNFAAPEIVPILMSFVGIGLLLVISVLIAKYVVPVAFAWIAKRPELILVGAVAWCFGIGFLGNSLDVLTESVFGFNWHMSVSMEMGALIAGASIASLPYSHEVVGRVSIVRDFFVTLFFVGLGMLIPVPDGPAVLILAVIFSVISIAARYLIFFPLMYVTGFYRRNAMVASTKLAQVSEFSLVIAFVGLGLGHLSSELVASIIFAFVITALITPMLFKYADPINDVLSPLLERLGFKLPTTGAPKEEEKEYGIALLGFHRVASSLLYELGKRNPALLREILVVDFNVNIHPEIKKRGVDVVYGDFSNPDTFLHTGVDNARVVICTVQDDFLKGTSNLDLVRSLKTINPQATIIVNAIEIKETERLYEAGADYVYMPRVEVAQTLAPILDQAINGRLAGIRKRRETEEGLWHERDEVFH
ncbi:MAG: sodium:proton exchanger [Planctomycetes bacterium]|nr:sodium:proton exchanger [Planctomycetota bacterium]